MVIAEHTSIPLELADGLRLRGSDGISLQHAIMKSLLDDAAKRAISYLQALPVEESGR